MHGIPLDVVADMTEAGLVTVQRQSVLGALRNTYYQKTPPHIP
jgi:hypothetical protein